MKGALPRPGMGRLRRGLAMTLSSLVLMLGLATGATAQTTCSSTDTAVTAVVTDANDTSGRAALAGDCATLLGLMDTLRGTASLNWANSLSMASWHGIIVGGSRVTEIRLSSRQLSGTIPTALNNLTSLEELILSSNELSGSIPDLSGLTSLTHLWLPSNELSGAIPDLSGLTSLQDLHFERNQLSGSIPDLSGLTSLTRLSLGYNDLSGQIPVSHLPSSLTRILLGDNELSGSIPDLSALTSLTHLSLGFNQLSGSIPALSNLTGLQELYLDYNQLTGSIPDLSNLTLLAQLFLNNNELSGSIPALSGLTQLTNLQLQDNQLSGSIPDLSSLTRLLFLYLQDNQLTGNIDASDFPTSISRLLLHRNQLGGSIPDLSALTSLTWLLLSDNQLTGSMDASHFPASLTLLYLHRNQLNGSIPDLSALTSLQRLYLHQNQLSGAIPTTLGSVTSLAQLHLAGNPLTGGIPSQLGSLNLTHLSLCGTDLDATATLPAALETRRTDGDLTVWSCARIEDASATEGQPLDFVVEHSTYPVRGETGATGGLTLSYSTRNGTASSDDYTGTAQGSPGSVTIPANTDTDDSTSSATISVPTIDDTAVEGAETIRVALGGVTGVFVLRSTATGTILDNDRSVQPPPPPPPNRPPRVMLSCAPCQVALGGGASLTATASDPDNDPLSYSWSASAGVFEGAADTATVRWTAPATVGAVSIRVTVSDGEGGRDSARVTVDVLAVLPEKLSYDIPARGSASFPTADEGEPARVGYGQIRPEGGSATPAGLALFGLRDRQAVLITEAGVPASQLLHRGRIFAEVGGPIRTAVAFANPNGRPAEIDYYVTDSDGNRVAEGNFTLEAYQHRAGFLNEEPFDVESVEGTFTFSASPRVGVMAFWELTNAPGECLVAGLPVWPLLSPPSPFSGASTAPVVLPHFSDGEGWSTDVILVNPTREAIAGRLEYLGPDAAPLAVRLADGRMGTGFEYAIAPHAAQRFRASNPAGGLASGSVRATPASGLPPVAAPQGLGLLTFATEGKTVAAAGVAAAGASTAFRVPVHTAAMPGSPGSVRTMLAVANTTDEEVRVSLEITRPDGSLAPPLGSLTLGPYAQTSHLLDALLELPEDFSSGLLRVSASGPVAAAALRLRINQRGELKAASLWPLDELARATTRDRYFAHLADTEAWSTELVLFSGTVGEPASGALCLFWFPVE